MRGNKGVFSALAAKTKKCMENFSFDFSKPEDQQKFENLKPTEKQEIVDAAQEEANEINEVKKQIKKYTEEIKNIASVFNIATEKFSISEDQKFANEEFENNELFKKYCEKVGTDFELAQSLETYFRLPHSKMPLNIQNNFQDYTLYQAQEIKENGSISTLGHDNIRNKIEKAGSLTFTPDEIQAMDKFASMRNDIKFKFESDYIMIEMKAKSLQNESVKNYLDWLKENDSVIDGVHDFSNTLIDYRDEFGKEESQKIREIIADITAAPKNQDLIDLQVISARVFAQIAKKFNQRLAYVTELAKSGDQRFENLSKDDSQIFKVDPTFQFTESDSIKATELNLPWSKYKSELEQ